MIWLTLTLPFVFTFLAGGLFLPRCTRLQKLIHFLRDELAIPSASIDLAVRHQPDAPNLLPMILWQYGLVTLKQLDQIFDWLETA
jgi:hypothetical protein